jgi:MSHA pilin protein MshD
MRTNKLATRHGITIAETVISMLLISFVLVSTLSIIAPISRSGTVHANKLVATNLASELAEEISTKFWTSPILDDPDSIGPGAGEVRSTFDDIDDYNGFSSSPPSLSSGSTNFALTGWSRSVKVTHVQVSDPSIESPTYTGLKKVIITVTKDGTALATHTSLHSHAADQVGFIVVATGESK